MPKKGGGVALSLSILYVFVLLSDSLFSESMKNRIVYFWGHLPGETVFSRLKNEVRDIRFAQQQVLEQYKNIYENMPNDCKSRYRYENSEWYAIYNKYRDNKMVYNSNRDYLICRDMTTSTVVIMLLYFIFSVVLKLIPFKLGCVIYLIVMFFVTNMATRTKGKRMVNNVIICDLQKRKKTIIFTWQANSHVNLLAIFRRITYNKIKEMMIMPNIKPISDLRNYTEVLKEVRMNQPVYLTRNGRGAYAIVDMNELDRLKATIQFLTKLEEGEQSARENGWLSADEVEAALGL